MPFPIHCSNTMELFCWLSYWAFCLSCRLCCLWSLEEEELGWDRLVAAGPWGLIPGGWLALEEAGDPWGLPAGWMALDGAGTNLVNDSTNPLAGWWATSAPPLWMVVLTMDGENHSVKNMCFHEEIWKKIDYWDGFCHFLHCFWVGSLLEPNIKKS